MRPLAPAAFALASLLSIASPAGADAPAAAPPEGPPAALTGPQLGAPAPAFTLKTLSGQTVSLESYRGKTLVINVWATWCPPCRQEMPDLISSYAKLRPSGVEFLGVDSTEEAPIVRAYVVAKGLAYPQAIDSDKRFSNAYDIQYFPTTLVIDPQGILRARYIDVIVPAQLAALTSAAQAGRSVTLVSPLQAKIDALLSDPSFDFSGDAAGVLAVAKKADAAIAKAEDLMNDSDAAGGNATDLLRTRSEEAALRDRAIQALAATTDSTPADNAFLARMRGDAARDREAWADALDAYQVVLALEPDNQDALDGVAMSAGRLEKYDVAIAADEKLATLNPTSAEALVDLGLAYGKVKRFDEAYATFDKAIVLAQAQVDAKPGDPKALRRLAWTHLYAGRTRVRGGDDVGARAQFEQVVAIAARLPAKDLRHDMYLEEGQEAIVALGLTTGAKTSLSLAPWTGTDLPGSVPNTIKYRLVVAGTAGKSIALHAAGVPKGWVASFCTDRVCAPFKVSVAIPASGVKIIEFQLVPPTNRALPSKVRVIGTDGGVTTSVTT